MALHFECVVVGPFQENTWIIGDDETGDAILVDPGNFDDRESTLVESALTRHGLEPKAIVNTHGHIDHIAGVHRVKARYGIPLYIHPGEKMWIEQVTQQCALFGFPPIPQPEVDGWLEDGQQLEVGSLKLEIRHVPGHTPGGCALVFPGHVITGDTLFAGKHRADRLPRRAASRRWSRGSRRGSTRSLTTRWSTRATARTPPSGARSRRTPSCGGEGRRRGALKDRKSPFRSSRQRGLRARDPPYLGHRLGRGERAAHRVPAPAVEGLARRRRRVAVAAADDGDDGAAGALGIAGGHGSERSTGPLR